MAPDNLTAQGTAIIRTGYRVEMGRLKVFKGANVKLKVPRQGGRGRREDEECAGKGGSIVRVPWGGDDHVGK